MDEVPHSPTQRCAYCDGVHRGKPERAKNSLTEGNKALCVWLGISLSGRGKGGEKELIRFRRGKIIKKSWCPTFVQDQKTRGGP